MTNKTTKYAFIDVQNTETTTLKVLGFEIDHKRLSTKIKEMIKNNSLVNFIEIDNLKYLINKK